MVEPTHLKKYACQIGSFPQVGVKIKKMKPPPRQGLGLGDLVGWDFNRRAVCYKIIGFFCGWVLPKTWFAVDSKDYNRVPLHQKRRDYLPTVNRVFGIGWMRFTTCFGWKLQEKNLGLSLDFFDLTVLWRNNESYVILRNHMCTVELYNVYLYILYIHRLLPNQGNLGNH